MAGIYVHIPFCKTRCSYCDFFSTTSHGLARRYVDALIGEAQLRCHELEGQSVQTVYFGGGTPSQLPVTEMKRVVDAFSRIFDLSGVGEFTVEVNPDDVTPEYIEALRLMGVNRISMGVQSFVDSELRFINRRHDSASAIAAIGMIKKSGIRNVTIDLIYGIPGQNLNSWVQSVATALEQGVQHISAYNLSYEEGTRLWKQLQNGDIAETDEELCLRMYEMLVEMLENAGYEHYEISNFALPGFRSLHNSSYWNGSPYLGLGAAAHSYDGNTRRFNPRNLLQYISSIERHEPAFECEVLTMNEKLNEQIMVSLRTKQGLDLKKLEQTFSRGILDELCRKAEGFISGGLAEIVDNRLKITKKGVFVSDAVIRDLMVDTEVE